MKRIFSALDMGEALRVQQFLEGDGLTVEIRGESLQGVGHIPEGEKHPSLWVPEQDASRAEQLLESYEESADKAKNQKAWRCTNCGEEAEGTFTACWACGTERLLEPPR